MITKESIKNFLFGSRKKTSAEAAKDRLKFILVQEHVKSNSPDYLPKLKDEILAVISKYVKINADAIKIETNDEMNMRGFTVSIDLPTLPVDDQQS